MLLFTLLLALSLSFGQMIVRIDDRIITREEFDRAFETYWRDVVHVNGRKATYKDRREFLFEYIKGIIIEKVASDLDISVGEGEVRDRLRRWGVRKASDVTVDMVRREIIMEKLTKRIAGDVKVSEGEIEAYYLLNKREFYYPDQIKLLRILVEDREKARKVYEALRMGKLPRGEGILVGKERWYSIESLPKTIKKKLYPYKVGRVSKPINLETGYLILKITDKRKAGFMPLSEVKEKVRSKLLKKKREEVMRRWFRDILKHYDLVIYLEELERL